MRSLLNFIEINLLFLAIAIAALGLIWPVAGIFLEQYIGVLLATLMFVISLTFDAKAVKLVLKRPNRQLWALFLVYGPMSLAGWLTGRLFFGSGHRNGTNIAGHITDRCIRSAISTFSAW